jgi:hypothetical protein
MRVGALGQSRDNRFPTVSAFFALGSAILGTPAVGLCWLSACLTSLGLRQVTRDKLANEGLHRAPPPDGRDRMSQVPLRWMGDPILPVDREHPDGWTWCEPLCTKYLSNRSTDQVLTCINRCRAGTSVPERPKLPSLILEARALST